MSLYDLKGRILSVQSALDEADKMDADTEQALRDTLDALIGEFGDDAEEAIKLAKNYQAESDALKAESDRLAKRSQEEANKARWIKRSLQDYMIMTGKTKAQAGLFKITLAKNGGKQPLVVDASIDRVPYKYKTMTWTVDTDSLRKAIEAGDQEAKSVAHLEERGQHLVIR